ncbi:phage tail protein [Achromobacter spanius]|uniref:phage tail protein n=1 Tax=Achromobacter spanius TaxID=217203 RepID=UPI003209489F
MTRRLDADALLALLPAFYQERDAAAGGPLRALLDVLARQGALVDADVDRLYDNWFIETCDEWVVPYLGDLLGVRALYPVGGGFSPRALVANTLRLRRRKGTALVLEELAANATGWPSRVSECFERVATTQHVNHPRPHALRTPDLRRARAMERTGGPFGAELHTADVRALPAGRYNLPNVALFLWRLQSYTVQRGDAAPATTLDGFYTVDPLGRDQPLFNRPRTETDIDHLADPINVPEPLSWRDLHAELEARRQALTDGDAPPQGWFADDGPGPVLQVWVDGQPVPAEHLVICDLAPIPGVAPEAWRRPDAALLVKSGKPGRPDRSFPAAGGLLVGLDPRRGRIALPAGAVAASVQVRYAYGFPGDIGAGPYDRSAGADDEPAATPPDAFDVLLRVPSVATPTLAAALAAVLPGQRARIIVDHDGSEAIAPDLDLPDTHLAIEAAPRRRPVFLGDWRLRGNASTRVLLDGLLLDGRLRLEGALRAAALRHCTLVPARGGVRHTGAAPELELTLRRCICGPVRSAGPLASVDIDGCLIDAQGVAPAAVDVDDSALRVVGSTLFGRVAAGRLDASNTLFGAPLAINRRQEGCVRYCHVPLPSVTPRRYRCQPDLATQDLGAAAAKRAAARVAPSFTSTEFGAPAYGQLARGCAPEIREGADNGAEIGAWNFLLQAQREANLALALDEYLRFGLEAGMIPVN